MRLYTFGYPQARHWPSSLSSSLEEAAAAVAATAAAIDAAAEVVMMVVKYSRQANPLNFLSEN